MSRLPHRRSVFRHNSSGSSAPSYSAGELQSPGGQASLSFYHRYFTKSVPVPAPASVTTYTPTPVVPSLDNDEKDERKNVATPRVSVFAIDFVRKFSFLSIGSLVLSGLFGMLLVASLVVVLAIHFTHQNPVHKEAVSAVTAFEVGQVATSIAAVADTASPRSFSTSVKLSMTSATIVSPKSSPTASDASIKSAPVIAATSSAQPTKYTQIIHSSSVTSVAAAVATPSSPAPISPNMGTVQSTGPFAYTSSPVRLAVFGNFADPTIYYDASSALWYVFGTNTAAGIISAGSGLENIINTANVQIATSPDFKTWTLLPPSSDPLPVLGDWAVTGTMKPPAYNINFKIPTANVWAPEVIQHPTTKQYLMYYSAGSSSAPAHCIGAATASFIAGPYTPLSDPLTCPASVGGAIDASAFLEPTNNTLHLAYKVDGNAKGHGGECGNTVAPLVSTPIMLQPLSADGLTLDPAHAAVQILDRTADDGPLVEAPSLVKVGGVYYLFFSSGCTRNSDYNVKYATATALYGPYTHASKPLLSTGDFGLHAPGSVTVRYAAGESASSSTTGWKIALHGRVMVDAGGIRPFFTAGLTFDTRGRTVSVVA